MPKFIVRASYISICEAEIEAESKEEAWDIAKQLDGSEFDARLGGEDWQLDSIREIPNA